jgi:hypothetical protein
MRLWNAIQWTTTVLDSEFPARPMIELGHNTSRIEYPVRSPQIRAAFPLPTLAPRKPVQPIVITAFDNLHNLYFIN